MAGIIDRIVSTGAWIAAIPLFVPNRPLCGSRGPYPVTAGSVPEADAEFAIEAARSGLAEAVLSEVAVERSARDEVRGFASRMVAEHTAANAELIRLGIEKRIAMPVSPAASDQEERDRLDALPADQFDDSYLARMVTDHERAQALFARQRDGGSDGDLVAFAARMHAIVTNHLNEARRLSEKTGKKRRVYRNPKE